MSSGRYQGERACPHFHRHRVAYFPAGRSRVSRLGPQPDSRGAHGNPDVLIGAALFPASDASRFITGHVLYVDGGGRSA